jgi:HD-like signal output (HDOD) protein
MAATLEIQQLIPNLELPAMPAAANRVNIAIANPRTEPADLARLIEADPGLASHVLRTCNSPFYGLSRRVSNVEHAVRLIGFRNVRDLVLAFSTRYLFKRFGPFEKHLWNHSMRTGLAARMLAERYCAAQRDEAFLAGQMHDVGLVFMIQRNEMAVSAAQALASHERDLCELQSFGFTHGTAGAGLLRHWNLPIAAEMAALHHHAPMQCMAEAPAVSRLVACVSLADQLCEHADGAFQSAAPLWEVDGPLGALGLHGSELKRIAADFNQRMAAASR